MLSLEEFVDTLPLFDSEEASLRYSKGARRRGPGFRYEELVIALVFVRCLRKRLPDFELTSDNSYAGKFDDVVVTWKGNRDRYSLLVQVKYKTSKESEEVKKGNLFSTSDNNKSDFNVGKYLKSFQRFKKNLSGCQYALVITTNVSLHDNALGFFRERRTNSVLGAELIDTGGRVYELNPSAYKCDPDFMEHFFLFCTQKGVNEWKGEICEELERLLGPSDSYDALCEELCGGVMEWKDARCSNPRALNGSWTKWRDIVRRHRVGKAAICDGSTKGLKFHGVENVRQLLRGANTSRASSLSAVRSDFVVRKGSTPGSLHCGWTEWEGAELQQSVKRVTDCNALTTRLKFRSVEVIRDHIERTNPAYVRPLSADTMALSITKIHQTVHPETHIVVNLKRFRELQQTVLRWWGPFCRWLVLVDDNAEEQTQCSHLLNKIRRQLDDSHRLVLVSMKNAASFQDSFCFSDVSDESWDDLLFTKIRLNGDEHICQLSDLVCSRAELQTMLKDRLPCLVVLARNSGYVKLGQSLDTLPANYVPRELVTRRYVKDEFFSSLAVRDVCVMDNSTYHILTESLRYLVKHYKLCTLDELEEHLALHISVPILAKAEKIDIIALQRICRNYKGLYVYIVKHNQCAWDVQCFNAGSGRIRHYIREQGIHFLEALDVSNNKVILEGRPGVGKSMMLLGLARKVKQNSPSSWIVQINLRECYEKFEKPMNGREVAELILQSVVNSEGVLAGLELILLKHCLQKYEDIMCLVDSFDEVCPDYAEECVEALNLLSPHKGKLVVTARPTAARLLEDHLGSLAHLVPVFNDSQLQKYLDGFQPRVPRMRIDSLSKPLKDLLRIPLFAEMYKDLMMVGTGLYDTLSLYETFCHYKFAKMYVAKFGNNLSDPGKNKEVTQLWRFHDTKLKNLACLHIFRKPIWVSGDDNFMKAREVHEVTGKKPVFKHRTFGEYFLAKWCFLDASQEACTAAYSSAHSGRSLEFFLEVFDRMASRGHRLLSAVVEGDERRARTLLQAGAGLAERDAWGRSALHLAAGRGAGASLLLALCECMQPCLAERDGLVHWTPLQYAAKRGHWGAVEALLQAGADLSQLGDIQDAVSLLLLKSGLRVSSVVQNLLVRIAEEYGHSKVLSMLWEINSNAERRHMNVGSEISEDFKDFKNKGSERISELHTAIECGDEEKVRKLIMQGADLNVQDENRAGMLHWAAQFNRVNCVELLIDAGSELEAQDGNGQTALHYAVKAESSDVVKQLAAAGACLDTRDKDGRTGLHCASRVASSTCARILVSAGAEVNVRDTRGATPLHYAAEENAGDITRVLIEAGADLKACDDDGMSALHYAALRGSANCARLLLCAGASVHTRDNVGATPLHYAVEANAADISRVLLDAGAHMHKCDEDGMTPLHYAADNGSAECAWQLITAGAGVNVRDKFGATPLHYAVKAKDSCTAMFLIDAGAYLQLRDMHGKTALHYAAHRGSVECASLLIGAGGDVNVRDNFGATPLHYAAEENAMAIIKLLFASVAHQHSFKGDRVMALHCAATGGTAKCAQLHKNHIIPINAPDTVGATPLHYAARAKNADCASLLVRAGADVRVQDEAGLTALHYAACARNLECISFLVSAGLSVNFRDRKGASALHYAAMPHFTIPSRMDALVEDTAKCIGWLLDSGAQPDTTDEQGKTALHYAVCAGNVAGVGLLTDAGCDVLATDKRGETALHCAVRAGSSVCFSLLLRSVATTSTS